MNGVVLIVAIGVGLVLYVALVGGIARVLGWLRDGADRDEWEQATHVRLHQVLDDRDSH